ncbi:TPR repeat protein [Neisseria zoodegmatis]|uniref:TPR repeat protein n=1 Tax=Neisseria zoodegmatis TaxID=326523 RepID=A0A378WE10_9NEIS|nr:tetratricopeptide repeat protein [Neisseria zoodegmatis]SUA35716.1 TPR repeat protein [Neisseria zoodegmatis]
MKYLFFSITLILIGCQESVYFRQPQIDAKEMEQLRQNSCPIWKQEDILTQYECLKLGAKNNNPIDQQNLATFYLVSRAEGSKKEAFYWFQKAANQGLPQAQHDLAVMYLEGDGIEKDNNLAKKWAEKAIYNGMVGANGIIGVIESENKNFEKAFKLYQIAADTGFAPAQYNLGIAYHNGEGVRPDFKEAVKWYELAANQGWRPAIAVLVDIYSRGSPEIPKDEAKVQYWQSKLDNE